MLPYRVLVVASLCWYHFSKLSINFHRTYEKEVGDNDIFMACDISIGNRLFNFQTITERKIERKKKLGGKKGFLSFYSVCMFFVCVFVCLCVCLSSLYRLYHLT